MKLKFVPFCSSCDALSDGVLFCRSQNFQFCGVCCRYDVELYQRIEQLIAKKLPLYPTVEEEVLAMMERVSEAQRTAKMVSQCEQEFSIYSCRVLELQHSLSCRGLGFQHSLSCRVLM